MSASAFPRFLDVMLPGGGWALAVTEAYLDESYRDDEPRIICVAGYLYRKSKAKEFAAEWRRYLKSEGVPYFHANEAASSKRGGIFYGKDVDAICRRLINLTHEKTAYGFAVTVNEDDYREIVQPREGMRSAYAFALKACVGMVRRWKEDNAARGPTSFFFERGHKHQGDADEFLSWLFGVPEVAEKYGYKRHDFVPKEAEGVHPADYLAWHWRLESARRLEPARKHPMRKDLEALVRPTDSARNYQRDDLMRLEAALRELEGRRHHTRAQLQRAQEAAIIGAALGES